MKLKASIISIVLIMSVFLTACGQGENTSEEEGSETLKVYTTIFPIEDFVKKIGGEHVQVKNIVPVGADAHSFEPSPKTMVDVSNADLYIYNGAGIEGFAETTADVLANNSVKILKASEGIELIGYNDHKEDDHGDEEVGDHGHEEEDQGHEEADDHGHEEEEHGHEEADDHGHEKEDQGHEEAGEQGHEEEEHGHEEAGDQEHAHGNEDPHTWLDPIRSIKMAENIKNALIELKPEEAQHFEENFAALKSELEQLDQEFQAMVSEVSKDTIVVSHAGYGYWTERYGINQVGISGISPTNEPSIRQLQEIIDYVQSDKIKYIMIEQNIPTNIADTVITQVGAEALSLHNLEALVQGDIDNNEDYFSLMRKNIQALKVALQ